MGRSKTIKLQKGRSRPTENNALRDMFEARVQHVLKYLDAKVSDPRQQGYYLAKLVRNAHSEEDRDVLMAVAKRRRLAVTMKWMVQSLHDSSR